MVKMQWKAVSAPIANERTHSLSLLLAEIKAKYPQPANLQPDPGPTAPVQTNPYSLLLFDTGPDRFKPSQFGAQPTPTIPRT